MNQNFKLITGLNYRFIGNLHVHVFPSETGIMTTSTDFTTCCTGTGRCCKKVSFVFSLVLISLLRLLFIWPIWKSNFSTNFTFFWIFLHLLVSFNIHVIILIAWNLADVWCIIFPLILLTFSYVKGLVLAIVKLKFCARPMDQTYVIKYCILLKLVYQNKSEVITGCKINFIFW